MNKPLILVSNDDGVFASGLQMLISVAREFGEVFVVAPEKGESGMSHAISIVTPIRAKLIKKEEGLTVYSCNGTPVDCVKLALNQLMERKPDYVLSGINHGSNASISVIYSGTMGAAIEGCFNCIPSAGFSLLDHSPVADFSVSQKYVRIVLENLIKDGLPQGTCLNVNIPKLLEDEIKGIEVCRMTKGVWKEEYDKRTDPSGRNYYWLTGYFKNFEPDADDTDEWLLDKGYVTIVPIQVDLTAYDCIDRVKKWNLKK
ncbi:MAG: 5'/3'-nucleotidase SurE [Bacteroidetes bacterium GWF2_38_335]|nr:MAG: 5'/3'-nucleotidase SurE [Bacteroidetes bacterium GWF2_38_335]OFY81060.1 MAG: 5'/3'-nucleotidase SurE [Bacteroidetes bacterium RIFOXYA12_FULL_38_20]HBS87623.1 5'/3'-nucleotidase SurE [Bacteroidales bacterium]